MWAEVSLLDFSEELGMGRFIRSLPLITPKITFNSTGGHIQTNATNSDIAGTFTTSGLSGSVSFTNAYMSAPICVITPATNPGTRVAYISTVSGSGFTVTISASGAVTYNYICIGAPNQNSG